MLWTYRWICGEPFGEPVLHIWGTQRVNPSSTVVALCGRYKCESSQVRADRGVASRKNTEILDGTTCLTGNSSRVVRVEDAG